MDSTLTRQAPPALSLFAIFTAFLKLGCTSFGGPVAHIGYLRHEFVDRRQWLDDQAYADLVALCQFLPGPASSQVGIALGASRAGLPGALAAWAGFTAPSAALMIGFGYGMLAFGAGAEAGWLHGLKLAAVAVVAQAVWSMGRQLCPDRPRATLAIAAALAALLSPGTLVQIGVILAGAIIGRRWLPVAATPMVGHLDFRIGKGIALGAWAVFFGMLAGLPVLAAMTGSHAVALFDSFYRSGSLVFGGGHVVLPLLRAELVPPGWVSDPAFLAGYGMAQAVPGPLFTFAAYLGTVASGQPNGWAGGLFALAAIFLPALLLVLGALPYWDDWRRRASVRAALNGVNAAVVGILLATLYDPIFTGTVRSAGEFGVALVAFGLLVWWKLSPLWVVIFAAAGATLLGWM